MLRRRTLSGPGRSPEAGSGCRSGTTERPRYRCEFIPLSARHRYQFIPRSIARSAARCNGVLRRFEAFGRVWGLRAARGQGITHHTCVVSYTEIGGALNGASAVWLAQDQIGNGTCNSTSEFGRLVYFLSRVARSTVRVYALVGRELLVHVRQLQH